MSKKVEFDYNNEHYVLEFNRDSIKYMESQGFVLEEFTKKPATMIEIAFQGAFLMHHRGVPLQTVNEIYESIGDKQKLNIALMTMVDETYTTLLNSDNKGKNIEWKVV